MKNKLNAINLIDVYKDKFTGLSDYIWDNPELSLNEYKASEAISDALTKFGFEVENNIADIPTAFCAKFGNGKPVIGFLGEYDALSGLSTVVSGEPGHGCGHHLLGVGSLAAAVAVKKYLEDSKKSGTVIYYGCPGEEGCASKAFMAKEGFWKNLDCALTWHPFDADEVVSGTSNSCIQVLYKFKGISSHAAASPEKGRSALDAVELMNIGVQFLREHIKDDCRIHYSIVNTGGVSPNVVQSNADVLYMTRAVKVQDCIDLQKRVDKIAQGAAMMTETEYDRVFVDGLSELVPNFGLEKVLYNNFINYRIPSEKMNYEYFRPGSTDVGDVSYLTPTAQINVGTFPKGTVLHTRDSVAFGKSEIAHDGMITAGKILAGAAIDLINNPEELVDIRKEFNDRVKDGYFCPIEDSAKAKVLEI